MDYHEFLHDLHFDIDKVRPTNLEVDWEDAPLPYKLYRGLKTVSLPGEVALCLDEPQRPFNQVRLRDVGDLLWYTYGLSQVSQAQASFSVSGDDGYAMQMLRRFVPSGGALYPCEVYVYLKIDELPAGVYHYDPAHHQLVLLRQGNFDDYLRRALFRQDDAAACFAHVFVSSLFWKNFFKYHNFSYRLQGLDAGALMGQLFEVSRRLQFSPVVHYHFLDEALNHLLGLDTEDESVYSVIGITDASLAMSGSIDASKDAGPSMVSGQSDEVCKMIPAIHHDYYLKSRNVREHPALVKMNQAALHRVGPQQEAVRGKAESDRGGALRSQKETGALGGQMEAGTRTSDFKRTKLPDVDDALTEFTAACRRRYSPGLDFRMRRISLEKLALLLKGTMSSVECRNDLNLRGACPQPCVSLFVCVHGVDGIEDGAYEYDAERHELLLRHCGDFRMDLQLGLSMPNVNLFDVPLCFHIVGSREHLTSRFGCRGYRIEQMEAGARLQRLLLYASTAGMAGHPLLGYDAAVCDDIYRICDVGKTCLIQVPVGFAQTGPRLQGPLFG